VARASWNNGLYGTTSIVVIEIINTNRKRHLEEAILFCTINLLLPIMEFRKKYLLCKPGVNDALDYYYYYLSTHT
jgi:hypothetical protein